MHQVIHQRESLVYGMVVLFFHLLVHSINFGYLRKNMKKLVNQLLKRDVTKKKNNNKNNKEYLFFYSIWKFLIL